jgi:hypothetical protein
LSRSSSHSRKKNCNVFANANIYHCNVDTSECQDFHMDTIISDQVMEHVKSPSSFCAYIKKSMAPNGMAYVALPNGVCMDNVLADPHLSVPVITLLPARDAAPMVAAVAGHHHYLEMMGPSYLKHEEVLELFRDTQLKAALMSDIPSVESMLEKRKMFMMQVHAIRSSMQADKRLQEGHKEALVAALNTYEQALENADFSDNSMRIMYGVRNLEYKVKNFSSN